MRRRQAVTGINAAFSCQLDRLEYYHLNLTREIKFFIQESVFECCLQNVGDFVSASMC